MAEPTSLEQGKIGSYPAEEPGSYNKGQTGKGVEVPPNNTGKVGTEMSVGGDSQAKKLKKTWNTSMKSNGRFGNFKRG